MDKHINRALAILLIGTIFVIGGVTLALNIRQIGYALLVNYTLYTEENGGVFDSVRARIQSLNATINGKVLGKDRFEKLNAQMQLALGKQVLSFGGTTMVRLNTGHLYDVESDIDVTGEVNKIIRMNDTLKAQGIPMVYAYAHSMLYEDGMLPTGVKDYNLKVADEIVGGLRAGGVTTLDSRDIYKDDGLTLDDAVFHTDIHWQPRMAFHVFAACAQALNETGKIHLDESAADIGRFDSRMLKNAYLGNTGSRLGADFVEADDFEVLTPAFDTHIKSSISSSNGMVDREGSFEDAVLNMELAQLDAPGDIYDIYGHHTEVVYYENENAPEGRLLIVKDSFGTPVASLMSLAVRNVCAIDLRKGKGTIEEYVKSFQPDAVLVVHCQEMMRGKHYAFLD